MPSKSKVLFRWRSGIRGAGSRSTGPSGRGPGGLTEVSAGLISSRFVSAVRSDGPRKPHVVSGLVFCIQHLYVFPRLPDRVFFPRE